MPFEAVYREHFASIWRAVQRFGVPERDAADIAQEVFLIAYRGFDKFEARSSIKTWLFGIAYRVSLGRLRRSSARREQLGDAELALQASAEPGPELGLEQRELARLLEAGLASLPIEQRAVLTLFELEGFTGEQIADTLGVPLGTVRSRLRLARATFSRTLRALSAEASRAAPRAQGGTL